MRPITLLNLDYKLVEKVLATRLKTVLHLLINEDQTGYLAGRQISTNIRRVLDLIDYTEETNQEGVIISVDFEKCFDRIEIQSITSVLNFFNFGPSFIKWTQTIYHKPIACVSNNGYFSTYFDVTRGAKQGGPASAYYFVLLVKALAIELRKNKDIQGFTIKEIM